MSKFQKYLAYALAIVAFWFMLIWSPAEAFSRKAPSPEPTISASPSPAASPLPIGSNIRLIMKDGKAYEATKLAAAERLANQILGSKCFGDFLTKRAMIQTNRLTPVQVLELLRATSVSVGVHFYYQNNGTVGYTYANDPDVYFNRKFHDDYGVRDEASNAMHEWSHKPPMSFDHAYRNPSAYSVPYSINYAVESCCTPEGECKP